MSFKYSVHRRSFTLVELLISITIITVLAATALFTLYGVMEQARVMRTRAQIARLNAIVMEKWDSYRTRALPISIPAGTTRNPTDPTSRDSFAPIAWLRLVALRELMRMELPERITDLEDGTTPIAIKFPAGYGKPPFAIQMPQPALWKAYRRAALGPTWTGTHQWAECLYLIIEATRDGDRSAIEWFTPSEIGDTDNDGRKEILDAWGRPIYFFRWAPGYTYYWGADGAWGLAGSEDNNMNPVDDIFERGLANSDDELVSEVQTVDAQRAPDPFDPLHVDYRWYDKDQNGQPFTANDPFALVPLIYSAGPDGVFDIVDEIQSFRHAGLPAGYTTCVYDMATGLQVFNNDPYHVFGPTANPTAMTNQIGMPADLSGPNVTSPDGVLGAADNITNHLITTR